MRNIDVVCIGSATIDVFVILQDVEKFSYDKFSNEISFPLGEKLNLGQYKIELGGNACNVSVGLSRLGLQSYLAAEIGNDEFSEKITNTLKKENVDQSMVKKTSRSTPYFNIVLSFDGERTILAENTPAQQNLNPGEINPTLIYLTSMNGSWQEVYEKAFSKNPNSKFALNPGNAQIKNNLDDILLLLPKIDILFVNLAEAKILAKESSPHIKAVMKKLKTWGVKTAVVTDGRNGSYAITDKDEIFQIGVASDRKPIERTGAGDAYAVGFIYAFINGYSVKEAMRYGAINADCVVYEIGAQKGLLKKEELDKKSKEILSFSAVKI